MPKPSHRAKILAEGLKVVHAQGFHGASVRDIVRAAGAPQGSFTNHFASKEAFGLEALDLYFDRANEVIAATLRNDALPPLQRLGAYVDANISRLNQERMRNGCLLGNFAAEAADCEAIRLRLIDLFAQTQESVAYCLNAAVKAGELPGGFGCDEVAAFIVSSLQGAYLLAKTQRGPAAVRRFRRVLFASVLR